jgi:hypothetical protein
LPRPFVPHQRGEGEHPSEWPVAND